MTSSQPVELVATNEPDKTNPFSSLVSQSTLIVPSFTLESGRTLTDIPVAYKTWGRLNPTGDNCLVICHALTGSADVEDWWGPLLGYDRAFDPSRWFIFCANVIGSPYGTVSSVTQGEEGNGRPWGPEMPGSTVKDDVRLHYLVLQYLGVKSVAAVIGGSMGGMNTLEYPLNTPPGFVRHIVALATSARHSAWCISWGEAQRQSIYSDPDYKDGYYYEVTDPATGQVTIDLKNQPKRGLAAARMAALLTYRSRDSFESRFGRRAGVTGGGNGKVPRGGVRVMGGKETTDPSVPSEKDEQKREQATAGGDSQEDDKLSLREWAWREHNDGHRGGEGRRSRTGSDAGSKTRDGSASPSLGSGGPAPGTPLPQQEDKIGAGVPLGQVGNVVPGSPAQNNGKLATGGERVPKIFSAQSYLRYQGDKFSSRFDANCYIHITRKLDTHDLSLPSRHAYPGLAPALDQAPTLSSQLPEQHSDDPSDQLDALHHALGLLPPALIIGIESDGLFTTTEQREIAAHVPDAELVLIPSPDGHDGFLLEFEAINGWVDGWLRRKVPEYFAEGARIGGEPGEAGGDGWGVKKESVFGEAEADVTRW